VNDHIYRTLIKCFNKDLIDLWCAAKRSLRRLCCLTDLEALYGALSQKAFKGELDLSRVPLPDENAAVMKNELRWNLGSDHEQLLMVAEASEV
jgi:hypothetical protein